MKQFNMKQTFLIYQDKNRCQLGKSLVIRPFKFKYWTTILAIMAFSSLGGCANCPLYGCSLWG